MCITETWLKQQIAITSLNEFDIYRCDRDNKKGGGTLIAVKKHIKSVFRKKISVENCECVIVDVYQTANNFTRFVSVYRPPDASVKCTKVLCDKLQREIENITYFMTGDFNISNIDWENMTCNSLIAQKFLTFCLKIGAHQCVNLPTREEKLLDLVLVPDRTLVVSVEIMEPFSTSDHCAIMSILNFSIKPIAKYLPKPCYAKADYELINCYLKTLEWDKIFKNCENTEHYWSAFRCIIDLLITNFVPMTRIFNKKPLWFYIRLRRLQRVKQKKYRDYCKNRTDQTLYKYKQSAKYYKQQFDLSKKRHETKLFAKSFNKKKFYNYVKSNSKSVSSIPPIKVNCDTVTNDNQEKADLFSKEFASYFTKDDGSKPNCDYDVINEIEQFSCCTQDIIKAVHKLACKSTLDPQNYSMTFVKKIIANIAYPLNCIYNMSLKDGSVPQDWKTAFVCPLLKKGDPQKCCNYRSVSLVSVFSKIIESIVKDQMLAHLDRNDLLSKHQHGFVPGKSIVTNLLHCLDDWTRDYDNGFQTDIIYLDYAKCFNSVSHPKLIHKLKEMGFVKLCEKWFTSFMLNRLQLVRIQDCFSSPVEISSGLPEGTVIGPVMFICYSLDLYGVVKNSVISAYADDSKLYKPIKSEPDTRLLQNDIDSIKLWSDTWQLKLNVSKTKLLTIGKKKFESKYLLGAEIIERVNKMRDLGIVIQTNLCFTDQCSNIIKKAHHVIRHIFRTFKLHDKEFYVHLYKTYVRPIVESSSQLWSPQFKFNIDRIEKIQRYFTRRMPGLENKSYLERLQLLGLETLEHRRICADLSLFYKIINKKVQLDSNSYCLKQNYRGNSFNLATLSFKTERRRNFYLMRIVIHWNKLNNTVILSSNIRDFKNKLEKLSFSYKGSAYS